MCTGCNSPAFMSAYTVVRPMRRTVTASSGVSSRGLSARTSRRAPGHPVGGAPGRPGGVGAGDHESAGKRHPSGSRRGNKWLAAMLVEAAGSVGRMKGRNYLSAQHARLTARRGMGRAAVAVAHSMLVSAYYILSRDEPYAELGADWLARRNDEAHTRRLVAQLEWLGHTVVLDRVARPTAQELEDGLRPPRPDTRLKLTRSRVCEGLRSRSMRRRSTASRSGSPVGVPGRTGRRASTEVGREWRARGASSRSGRGPPTRVGRTCPGRRDAGAAGGATAARVTGPCSPDHRRGPARCWPVDGHGPRPGACSDLGGGPVAGRVLGQTPIHARGVPWPPGRLTWG
jgi:hypothetical protein